METTYKKTQTYCSAKCHFKSMEGEKLVIICKGCKKKIITTSKSTKYCSRGCYMKHSRVGNTSIEIAMQELLDKMSISYETHKKPKELKLLGKFKRHLFDIVIPDKKLVIECDGVYWHGPAFPENQKRDKEITDFVKRNTDWSILRFDGNQIRDDSKSIELKIRQLL